MKIKKTIHSTVGLSVGLQSKVMLNGTFL